MLFVSNLHLCFSIRAEGTLKCSIDVGILEISTHTFRLFMKAAEWDPWSALLLQEYDTEWNAAAQHVYRFGWSQVRKSKLEKFLLWKLILQWILLWRDIQLVQIEAGNLLFFKFTQKRPWCSCRATTGWWILIHFQ